MCDLGRLEIQKLRCEEKLESPRLQSLCLDCNSRLGSLPSHSSGLRHSSNVGGLQSAYTRAKSHLSPAVGELVPLTSNVRGVSPPKKGDLAALRLDDGALYRGRPLRSYFLRDLRLR